jgi:hypothetical protein
MGDAGLAGEAVNGSVEAKPQVSFGMLISFYRDRKGG